VVPKDGAVVIHRVGPTEKAKISELARRVAQEKRQEPLSERMWLDLERLGADRFTGVLWSDPGDDTLTAYCQLHRDAATWVIETLVDPGRPPGRGRPEPMLLDTAIGEIRRQGGGEVSYRIPAPTAAEESEALQAGFTLSREIQQLRVALPLSEAVLESSPPVAVRPFRPGTDDAEWLAVNNRAFAGHPEQGHWDIELLQERQAQPWFDPGGLLVHDEEGRIAASCWTKVHGTGDSALGEIYVISVDPDFQGRGLGRALTVAGLEHLSARGLRTGMLYVDDSNTTARHLYASLGFGPDHVDRFYSIHVPRSDKTNRSVSGT